MSAAVGHMRVGTAHGIGAMGAGSTADEQLFSIRDIFRQCSVRGGRGATIHVVWHDDRDGNTEIYYKRSTDNGTTWGADTRLTTDISWSERPSVAVRNFSYPCGLV